MGYFFGQNTNALLGQAVDSVFSPNRAAKQGGSTARITEQPEGGDDGGLVGGGVNYPITPPGTLDKCRKTNGPCSPDEYESTYMGQRLCCKRAGGGDCKSDTDCPMGQMCDNGKCVPRDIAEKPCLADTDCPAGLKCVETPEGRRCQRVDPTQCPDGVGAAYDGCPCGKAYMLKSGACQPGYVPVQKPEGIQCECQKMCIETGWGEDCQTPSGGAGAGMGAYSYPSGLQGLMDLLLGRGKQIMGMPFGYGEDVLSQFFGRDFENIRAQEAAKRKSVTDILGGQGLLGTGTATKALSALPWETEQQVAETQRDIYLANEAQKRQDLSSYTGMGQDILSQLLGSEQLMEAINAARRGERQSAINALLTFALGLK